LCGAFAERVASHRSIALPHFGHATRATGRRLESPNAIECRSICWASFSNWKGAMGESFCCFVATHQIMRQSFEYITCMAMVILYDVDIETGRLAT